MDRETWADRAPRRRLGRRAESGHLGGLARAPQQVPASPWVIPDPDEADDDGVVGVGADLLPSTLVDAYRRGIFPWPHPGVPLPWFSPDPRGVLAVDQITVSRSLRRTLRRCAWRASVDVAFDEVVAGCAQGRGEAGTWITAGLARAYGRLHRLGWAHSVEVWDGQELVGGVYGVQVGGIFTGESMFHRETDASKVALLELAARLAEAGGALIDVQLTTDHLRTLGARDVPRAEFLAELRAGRDLEVRLRTETRPVERLLELVPRRASLAPPTAERSTEVR